MRRNFVFVLLLLGLGLVIGQAFAQPVSTPVDVSAIGVVDVPVEPEGDSVGTVERLLTVWLPRLCMACAALTAFFPSTNKVMKLIDLFAFSWGKARNDPNAQRWGKAV